MSKCQVGRRTLGHHSPAGIDTLPHARQRDRAANYHKCVKKNVNVTNGMDRTQWDEFVPQIGRQAFFRCCTAS